MKKSIILFMFLAFALALTAQTKKVAILETVDKEGNVPYGIRLQLRSNLTYAISSTPGYEGLDRVDMSQIMGEHNFQRTGMVSDEQIRRLGEITGASSILVAEAAIYDAGHIIITAKILNVETASVENSAPPQIASTNPEEMQNACTQLAVKLIGGSALTGLHRQNFTETAYGLDMRMIYVEGGTFTMGCTNEQEGDCFDNESPSRRTMVNSFYIGMFEVTQSQWEKVMGTTVYQQKNKVHPDWQLPGAGSSYPMYYVSWSEAEEFCQKLSQQTGKTYRLPTEAEWEYAARGGKKAENTKYSGSSDINKVAWYSGNNNGSIHPCGTKQANALGIYDMSGNVWEWCEDWYGSYIPTDIDNPKGASPGEYRVVRGGSWTHYASYCRVSCHDRSKPDNRDHYGGFRVVMVP